MPRKILCAVVIALFAVGIAELAVAAKGEQVKHIGVVEKERSEFRTLLMNNPNYFGTMPHLEFKAVKVMSLKTKYEELRCLGFYPERDMLQAVVDVKRTYGYNGDLCAPGSYEYVRFYVDWNGDGDFVDEGEDVGMSSVNVHDIPDTKAVRDVPLSYAVTIKVDPKRHTCSAPNLVKVRAILSWNLPPSAGSPGFPPVWGNVIETWIQIKPRPLLVKEALDVAQLKKLKIDADMVDGEIPISKGKALGPMELEEIYTGKDVSKKRFDFSDLYEKVKILKTVEPIPLIPATEDLPYEISAIVDELYAPIPSTKYEDLGCVGINYDLSNLVATLNLKLPYGYSGDLCHAGSHEYVAFWIHRSHPIIPWGFWDYVGTASVNVHDIGSIPSEGLSYAVSLPVDLASLQEHCSKPQVVKVRAILSWQVPPPSNDPFYDPVWGNTKDAAVQIKPGWPVIPGQRIPFISVVGEMAVESISGAGYANGPSVYGGYTAIDSPFGGTITICGHISNPPDDPAPGGKIKYKVLYKSPGGQWQAITNKFKIWITKWDGASWTMSSQDQVADGDGYFTYEEDFKAPTQTFVEGNVLAQWYTPPIQGDGVYKIRVTAYDPTTSGPHISSNIVTVKVDNTKPDAKVSLDAGPCTQFTPGQPINGKFTATDQHIWKYALSVGPMANPPVISPTGSVYPALSVPGLTDEWFGLTTTGATPCGYVVYLEVWDRTIRNNHLTGNKSGASVGLCLLED